MPVRQIAHTLCNLVRAPAPPHKVGVHKVGVHKVGSTKLGKVWEVGFSEFLVFDKPFCYVAKSKHVVRVLMCPGFVSGGPGAGKTTFVYLIQCQCNHVFL